MLRTSNDDCRDYSASDLKESIDLAIKNELAHERPNGYATKPYDPAQWQEYWNSLIYYVYDVGPNDCHGKYKGPTGPELIAYILQERRSNGLPELTIEARNENRVH